MTEPMMPASPEGKMITWRSLLAIVFAVFVVQPATMYLYLVTGATLPLSAWLVILLWAEIARAFGSPLSRGEIFMISSFGAAALGSVWLFINPLRNLLFVMSPITAAFGFSESIPSWWAPPLSTALNVWAARSLFHTAWIVPTVILLLTAIFDLAANVAMGYFSYQLYAVTEKLDFPQQAAAASSIITIADRPPDRIRVLMIAALLGVGYGIVSNLLPTLTGSPSLAILPRVVVDYSYLTSNLLTGSTFAIDTTLSLAVFGLVIPLPFMTVALATNLAVYFVGNHYLYEGGIWSEWTPGMVHIIAYTRSQLYFWASLGIGIALAAAFIPLAAKPRRLIRSFATLAKGMGQGSRGGFWLLLALFFGVTLASVALVEALVPGFPLWILILFSVGWSFFVSFISSAAMGYGSTGFNIPYLREAIIYFSGYRGVDIWFANFITSGTSVSGLPLVATRGGEIAGYFRMADAIIASKGEYVKALVIVTLLSAVTSFTYAAVFWNVSQIPSSAYPYTITGWPVEIMERNRWIRWLWTGILFKPIVILEGFGVGAAAALIGVVTHLEFVPVALVMGIFNPMSVMIGQFVASLLGTLVFPRLTGKEWWRNYAGLILMGIPIGDGIIYTATAAIQLAIRSQWLLPY